MKHLISLFILSINYFGIFSQNLQLFEGTIDKYPIKMILNYNGIDVYGYYYYTMYGKPIQISGKKENGKIILEERNEINTEEETSASIILEGNIGYWKSDTKQLKIALKPQLHKCNWEIFNNEVDLTHTFKGVKKLTYPIEVAIMYPDDYGLMNLIIPIILNIDKKYYGNIWECFNNYTIKKYEEYFSDFFEEYPQHFEIYNSGYIQFISDSIISYKYFGDEYSGGVHGYEFENYYVFDIKRNKQINFNDIFIEGSEKKIAEILFEQDNKKHKLDDFAANLNNFYMTNKGIGFVFNRYIIDCYACGIFNYFIDFKELKELIK